MTMKELKNKTSGELSSLIQELRLKVQGFRFAAAGGKGKNVKELREAKKTIARASTLASLQK